MGETSIGGTKALLTEHFLSVVPTSGVTRTRQRPVLPFPGTAPTILCPHTATVNRTAPTGISRNVGHTKLESTVRYLGIEVDDGLEIGEQTEV